MPGGIGGAMGGGIPDSFDSPATRALQFQKRRQLEDQTKLASQQAEDRSYQQQLQNNNLRAQNYALDQSHMMQANPDNPRKVTDTSMTIGNDGAVSGKINSSTSSGGTTKVLPPNISGHYMNLLEGQGAAYKAPTDLNMKEPMPRESMLPASFGPGDATAHQDAAFARLKDKSGDLARSSISSLASELAGRGISGASGSMARGIGDRISAATQPLADLNVAHLGEEYQAADRARQMAEGRSQAEFSGNLQQRGQDMGQQNALNALKMALSDREYESGQTQRKNYLDMILRYL